MFRSVQKDRGREWKKRTVKVITKINSRITHSSSLSHFIVGYRKCVVVQGVVLPIFINVYRIKSKPTD